MRDSISIAIVEQMTSLTAAEIHAAVRVHEFPAPVAPGLWNRREVYDWIDRRGLRRTFRHWLARC